MTSDDRLRSLERAHAADPSDVLARERLEAEWLRAGLGWHGERLPENARGCLVAREDVERGVYRWAVLEKDQTKPPTATVLDLVYVPGGEVECERCSTRPYGERTSSGLCAFCFGSGRRTIAPFYLGRFPLTNAQFLPFRQRVYHQAKGTGFRAIAQEQPHHPVTGVSHGPRPDHLDMSALAFCSWTGLRLPSSEEWRFAARGGEAQRVPCDCALGKPTWHKVEGTEPLNCVRCKGLGSLPRRFPWGNEGPTPERCVWAGEATTSRPSGTQVRVPLLASESETVQVGDYVAISGLADVVRSDPGDPHLLGVVVEASDHFATVRTGRGPGGTAPVTVGGKPARPSGASWCGAHDMAGNVGEWTSEGHVYGGSFRDADVGVDAYGLSDITVVTRGDDMGFRVALSANA